MTTETSYSPFRDLSPGSKVLLAFSGGVDSTIAAHMCKEAGLIPIAVNMKFLEEEKSSTDKVLKAADALGIALIFLELQKEFSEKVMRPCWNVFAEGRTPNPCALCNPVFKFGILMDYAKSLDCAGLITGHYARIVKTPAGNCVLRRGTDRTKDQSYFLYGLSPEQLAFSYMPLGAMEKREVKRIAAELGLPNADSPESQDACFSPKDGSPLAEKLRLMFHAEPVCGSFIHAETKKILGPHNGIHAYTVGQRKGTGVALGKPAYIRKISKDDASVEITDNENSLFEKTLSLSTPNWLMPGYSDKKSFCADVQIRYRSKAAPATVEKEADGTYSVTFDTPQRAITPGQSAVFYDGDTLIGGAEIL